MGFPKAAYVGACALVSVIKGNKLYVAQAGDSEAVLIRRKEGGEFESIKVCKAYTCNDPDEQKRLKAEFPKEPSIVKCRSPTACYVKGSLMPSRALGDFRLKHKELNFHNKSPEYGYRQPFRVHDGPYITHKPDIRAFDLTKDDAFLILASDGLWDEMKVEEVPEVIKGKNHQKEVGEILLNECLNRVSQERGYSRDYISHLRAGPERRNVVDDITIVVVDLQNQAQ
mmetsp:Transcript_18139/g.17835  ORF Transcript_18139/g.17835 Transcript_18139/m.17835 type:complete len:227 (+) Transcript_18139:563-1243(+)